MSGEELSAGLWQARRQLELLLFHLETQRLHLAQGNPRWLKFTAAQIEPVVERLKFETLALSVESASLASEWGGSGSTDLATLISLAPPGLWPEMLGDHRRALAGLVLEIREARSLNEHALTALDPDAAVQTFNSGPGAMDGPDPLVVRSNVKRALEVVAKTDLPRLEEFLGQGIQ